MIYKPCKVIAEIGCNHQGKFEVAVEMIKMAKICGADYVKFQKRNTEECIPKEVQNKPHPCPMNAFGETYLEHRKALEFSLDQHIELKKICYNLGIGYSCSTWDITSARQIISLNPDYIKVPSPANNNFDMLNILFQEYNKDVHISLGMTTKEERKKLFDYLYKYSNRVVLYWTTSEYPVPFDRLYLLEILNLRKDFPRVGYSGHNYGISVDMLAYCLGAEYIERHFTLDRTWKGTDQAASLEADGLRRLCRDLGAAYKSLTYKNCEMTDSEIENRKKLKINF